MQINWALLTEYYNLKPLIIFFLFSIVAFIPCIKLNAKCKKEYRRS